jgi:hypothetical protein
MLGVPGRNKNGYISSETFKATKFDKICSGYQQRHLVEWGLNQAFGDHFCPSNQRNDSVPWLLRHKSSPKRLLLVIQPPEMDE